MFLRNHLWSKEPLTVDRNAAGTNSKSVSQGFSEGNVVLKLSLLLLDFKYTEVDLLLISLSLREYICLSFSIICLFLSLCNSFILCSYLSFLDWRSVFLCNSIYK